MTHFKFLFDLKQCKFTKPHMARGYCIQQCSPGTMVLNLSCPIKPPSRIFKIIMPRPKPIKNKKVSRMGPRHNIFLKAGDFQM